MVELQSLVSFFVHMLNSLNFSIKLLFPQNLEVGGYLGPIDIPLWQNINCMRNFQYQYALPAKIYTSFSTFPYSRRFSEGRGLTTNKDGFKGDSSRKVAYKLVEAVMNKEGRNGRQCLLRTICEVAETPLAHNGLIGELLHIFFR